MPQPQIVSAKLLRDRHPVWQVYDEFRTSRLAACCLRESISRWKCINTLIEVIIGIGSASSVAGLSFLKSGPGADAWTVIGALAILLKVVKPVFGLRPLIERRQKLAIQFDDLYALKHRIETRRAYNQTSQKEFHTVINRYNGKLHDKEGDLHAAAARKKKCQERIEREFPGRSFYIPSNYDSPAN